jgi:hypothetical protein
MVITIQIRESVDNSDADTNRKIELRIVGGEDLSEVQSPVWSFITVSNNSDIPILHSKDAEEATFLNYASPMNPTMTLTLPSEGDYTIKGVARILEVSIGPVNSYTLNDEGKPVESTKDGEIYISKFIESAELTINVSSATNTTWV